MMRRKDPENSPARLKSGAPPATSVRPTRNANNPAPRSAIPREIKALSIRTALISKHVPPHREGNRTDRHVDEEDVSPVDERNYHSSEDCTDVPTYRGDPIRPAPPFLWDRVGDEGEYSRIEITANWQEFYALPQRESDL